MSEPIEIFISYAREDRSYLEDLTRHLRSLKRQNLIQTWSDADITAGTEWKKAIETHLDTAQVFLLLISSTFIASDYCYGIEMKRALERHERGEVRVIPIMLSTIPEYARETAPFDGLKALPKDAKQEVKPIKSWRDKEEAYARVVDGIGQAIKELTTQQSPTTPIVPSARPPEPKIPLSPLQRQRLGTPLTFPRRNLGGVVLAVLAVLIVGVGLFALLRSRGSPNSPSPPPPTLLGQTTDWSKNLNGWTPGSSQWKQNGGLLTSDGSIACCGLNDLAIWAPYTNLPNDYTVEAEIREKGVNEQQPLAPGEHGRFVYFGVLIRGSQGTNYGYSVQIEGPTNEFVKVVLNIPSAQSPDILLMNVKEVLKDNWHIYQVAVKGSSFTVKIDNEFMFTINDDTFTKGQAVGLWDSGGLLEVRSFKVYSIAP